MRITTQVDKFLHFDGSLRVEFNAPHSEELSEILEGEVDIDIVPHKEKRSLSANAYAWVLIDKIAAALHKSKLEVYQETVKDIGGVSEYVCIQDEAIDRMKKIWTSKGIGWTVEVLDSKIDGCSNLKLTYGSSVYNTQQMSLLIDHLIQDCEAMGIEYLTPDEIQNLLSLWEEQNG